MACASSYCIFHLIFTVLCTHILTNNIIQDKKNSFVLRKFFFNNTRLLKRSLMIISKNLTTFFKLKVETEQY